MCLFDVEVWYGDWVVVFGLNGLGKLYFFCLLVWGGSDFDLLFGYVMLMGE